MMKSRTTWLHSEWITQRVMWVWLGHLPYHINIISTLHQAVARECDVQHSGTYYEINHSTNLLTDRPNRRHFELSRIMWWWRSQSLISLAIWYLQMFLAVVWRVDNIEAFPPNVQQVSTTMLPWLQCASGRYDRSYSAWWLISEYYNVAIFSITHVNGFHQYKTKRVKGVLWMSNTNWTHQPPFI